MHESRPPYRMVPPGDTLGLKHLRVALHDVQFPMRTSDLRDRVGGWRMPVTGSEFTPLADWLEGVPDRKFRSAEEVSEAVARAHPELRE